MLRIVLRKMLKTRWMVLCLLTGVLVAGALLSSIPQYTGGILQKVLTKDLENFQAASGAFPGTFDYKILYYTDDSGKYTRMFGPVNDSVEGYYRQIGLPFVSRSVTQENTDYILPLDDGSQDDVDLAVISDLEKHIRLVGGHLPADSKQNGAYEVMVTTNAMNNLRLNLGQTYTIDNASMDGGPSYTVTVCGVFEAKDKSDAFWYNNDIALYNRLIFNEPLFMKDFGNPADYRITGTVWHAALDYHKITLSNIDRVAAALTGLRTALNRDSDECRIPALDILRDYDARQKQLRLLLAVLEVPVILMTAFYLLMVARLIVEEERSEIAVLKSRGASRAQIMRSYLTESLLLGGFALIFGPMLGLAVSGLLGSCSGFLQFVTRTGLPVRLEASSWLYALAAVGIFIVTMLLPAFQASKTSIVVLKQEKRKKQKAPFWKKYFLDFALVAVALYGVYRYRERSGMLRESSASANSLPVDPLLLLVSTLFILGLGLVFIRIYPFIIRGLFRAGRRFWKPPAYASMLYVARAGGMNQFLILFLVFTVSVGIFNATAARTINTNAEEKIRYAVGADVTLTPVWQTVTQPGEDGAEDVPGAAPEYIEPDFSNFENLKGVSMATRVFRTDTATVTLRPVNDQAGLFGSSGKSSGGNAAKTVSYLAVVPSDFGKMAWFRNDLLPYHWFNYLNLLTRQPQALLVSRAFQKEYGVKLGDALSVQITPEASLSGIVGAFVDYWPTLNPNAVVAGQKQPLFVVGNFNYFQAMTPLMPYQIWLKKAPGATSKVIYDDIAVKKMPIASLQDAGQEIIKSKNDPILEGVNGALTLSFLVTMLIAAAGFLIYWIMSIRSRSFQFGVLRAMGVTFRELIGMLALEQLLLSVFSVVIGAGVGSLTSAVFVPMLQIAFNASDQVPPFRVAVLPGDIARVFVIMGGILLAGLAALSLLMRRQRIDQAVKLGED